MLGLFLGAFAVGWVLPFGVLSLVLARRYRSLSGRGRRVALGAVAGLILGGLFTLRNPPDPDASLAGLALGTLSIAVLGAIYGWRAPSAALSTTLRV